MWIHGIHDQTRQVTYKIIMRFHYVCQCTHAEQLPYVQYPIEQRGTVVKSFGFVSLVSRHWGFVFKTYTS